MFESSQFCIYHKRIKIDSLDNVAFRFYGRRFNLLSFSIVSHFDDLIFTDRLLTVPRSRCFINFSVQFSKFSNYPNDPLVAIVPGAIDDSIKRITLLFYHVLRLRETLGLWIGTMDGSSDASDRISPILLTTLLLTPVRSFVRSARSSLAK